MKNKKATLIRLNDWDSILAWDISKCHPSLPTYEFDYLVVEGTNSVKAKYVIHDNKDKKAALKAVSRIIDTYKDMETALRELEFDE